jgi:hypothetical protein
VPAAKARGLGVRLDEDEVRGEWLPLARSAALARFQHHTEFAADVEASLSAPR